MALNETFGKQGGVTLADLKDNEALIAGALVAAFLRFGNKADWFTALGAGATAFYIMDRSAKARARKALFSVPHGMEMGTKGKPPITVVPQTRTEKGKAKP